MKPAQVATTHTNVVAQGEQPTAMVVDRVTLARTFSLPALDAVAAAPAGYVTPSPDERRRNLRSLDGELVAEAKEALTALSGADPAALKADLGEAVAEAKHAPRILAELRATDALITRVEGLLEFLKTRRAIAGSDTVRVLEAVEDEVSHRAKRNPSIADRYSEVMTFIKARSAKIADGMESAKSAEKPAPPTP